MVDVVFLLIIFFMTTAQFSRLTRAEINLPKERGEQKETPEEAGIVINIGRDGELIISDRTVSLDELEAIVRDEARQKDGDDAVPVRLLIRADRDADAEMFNRVVTLLTTLGVGEARLATQVPTRIGGGP